MVLHLYGLVVSGFNWGPRRVKDWPIPANTKYTTWMMPSVGRIDPTWVKALVIDTGSDVYSWVTIDAIGTFGLRKLILSSLFIGRCRECDASPCLRQAARPWCDRYFHR